MHLAELGRCNNNAGRGGRGQGEEEKEKGAATRKSGRPAPAAALGPCEDNTAEWEAAEKVGPPTSPPASSLARPLYGVALVKETWRNSVAGAVAKHENDPRSQYERGLHAAFYPPRQRFPESPPTYSRSLLFLRV